MQAATEQTSMGRKKKANPRDDAAVKVDRQVYIRLKLISLYQRREIAEIVTELLDKPTARLLKATEAKAHAEAAKKAKGEK